MKYMLLIYGDDSATKSWTDADWANCYAGHQAYGEALEAAGVMQGGAELKPAAAARCVRFAGGKTQITDGPFAEARETLGGYYLIETETLEQALDWAAKMPCLPSGGVEVRELGMN